jgi:hypothetical protein
MKKRGSWEYALAWKEEEAEEQSDPLQTILEVESMDNGDLLLPGEGQKSQPPTRPPV